MFLRTVQGINGILDDAERIGVSSYFENCLGCLTGYLSLLCFETQYDKVIINPSISCSVHLFVAVFSLIWTLLIHSILCLNDTLIIFSMLVMLSAIKSV